MNDPRDSGGETKYGISKKAYPDLDIMNLTAEQAREIYHKDYWLKAGCERLPQPLDIVVFDTAANCGAARAVGWLKKTHQPADYLFLRLKHYADLNYAKYMRGWIYRVIDLWERIRPMMR